MQLNHNHHTPAKHDKEIILLCDHLSSPANAGSIFRVADAFGVQEIIFGQGLPDIKSGRLRKTARHTERIVRFRESVNPTNTLLNLHKEGYHSIALEITDSSKPIRSLTIVAPKIVLVIGGERHGITEDLLKVCKDIGHILMYGSNSSMNVAQATGIALYEITSG